MSYEQDTDRENIAATLANVLPKVEHLAEAGIESLTDGLHILARLESELADRMVNHMAAELATDIKQILGVKERREMLRSLAREHMDAVMRAGVSSD